MKTNKYKSTLMLIVLIITFAFVADAFFVFRFHNKMMLSRWPLGAIRYNSLMGYELTPSFSGKTAALKDNYFIKIHDFGYRISTFENASAVKAGGVLALGCSFTFGDFVEAENTFASVFAKKLRLPLYNYGTPAYSYANVLLQLKQLKQNGMLDKLNPSIVVLGVGSWLYERSLNPFAPTNGPQFAYPYICKKGETIVIANEPKWCSIKNYFDFSQKYFPEGLNEVGMNLRRFRLMSLNVPRFLTAGIMKYVIKYSKRDVSSFELYDFVIMELKKTIGDRDIKIIVLWMPYFKNQPIDEGLKEAAFKNPDILLVNGVDVLRVFQINDNEYVRRHPSSKAHQAYGKYVFLKYKDRENEGDKHAGQKI